MRQFVRFAALVLPGFLLISYGATTLSRRAAITGGGGPGSGKCTIEVDVDGTAEVAVSGDTARLTTLAGQTAVWRRFQCTAPMPRNIGDFRFSGVDGRGSQSLVRDPRMNRGTAVIRIDDPQSGRQGYTFDIEWRASGGGSWGPPPPVRPPYGGAPPPSRYPMAQAIKSCQDGVVDRLNRDGYQSVSFQSTNQDNQPGRNEWIVGAATAKRGYGSSRFAFSCSVDFNAGRIRSVDVQKR